MVWVTNRSIYFPFTIKNEGSNREIGFLYLSHDYINGNVGMIVQDEGSGCFRGVVKPDSFEARETELASQIG
jgi:hypothetical protein